MGLFFLGLVFGLILGVNYRLVTDRLTALFGAQGGLEAPFQLTPGPEILAPAPPVPTLAEAPKRVTSVEMAEAVSSDEEGEASEASAPKPVLSSEPVPIVFESREPSWVDVPFVKKPKVEFRLEPEDRERPLQTLTLALGERGTLMAAPRQGYEVRTRLVGLSKAVWLFNVGGTFDSLERFALGEESMTVFYETPAHLREPGRLLVKASGELVRNNSSDSAEGSGR